MKLDKTEKPKKQIPQTKRYRPSQIVMEEGMALSSFQAIYSTDNLNIDSFSPTPLVIYGSSPVNSDQDSPPQKRLRQGTIGAEGRAQIFFEHVEHANGKSYGSNE